MRNFDILDVVYGFGVKCSDYNNKNKGHEIKIEGTKSTESKERERDERIVKKVRSYILNDSTAFKYLLEKEYYALTNCAIINQGKTLYIALGQLGVSKPNVIVISIPTTNIKTAEDIKVSFVNDAGHFTSNPRVLSELNSLVICIVALI